MTARAALLMTGILALSGCEITLHEETSSTAASAAVYEGRFIDSNVDGLVYYNPSLGPGAHRTHDGGRFEFRSSDDVVSFHVGPVPLGLARAGNGQVSPATLVDFAGGDRTPPICSDVLCGAFYDESRVYNRARLLIALDADQDPSNGIDLPDELTHHLYRRLGSSPGSFPVRFEHDFFVGDVQPVLDAAADYYGRGVITLPPVDETIEHLRRSFTPLPRPTGLVATDRGDCSVQLTWDAAPARPAGEVEWVDQFNVYLGTPATPPSNTTVATYGLGEMPGREHVFLEPGGAPLPRGTYIAFITAVRDNGIESRPSDSVTFTVDCIEPARRDAGTPPPPPPVDGGTAGCGSWQVNGAPPELAERCAFSFIGGSASRLEVQLFGTPPCDLTDGRRVRIQLQELSGSLPIPNHPYRLVYEPTGNRGELAAPAGGGQSNAGFATEDRGWIEFSSVVPDELAGTFSFITGTTTTREVVGSFTARSESCDWGCSTLTLQCGSAP